MSPPDGGEDVMVEVSAGKLLRLVTIATAAGEFVREQLHEPKGELQAERRQQKLMDGFEALLDSFAVLEEDDLSLPWVEEE